MAELHKVRRFPEQDQRVETGPIMFGDDWPGLFLRGDECHQYACSLRESIFDNAAMGLINRRVLMSLLEWLESSNANNNDAFPAWHPEDEGGGDEIHD